MGNQACISARSNQRQGIICQLLYSIDNEKPELAHIMLEENRNDLNIIDINQAVISWKDQKISILTYSFLKGSSAIFKDLIEMAMAKIYVMNNQLKEMGTDPLEIICEKGYLQILRYLFPRYLKDKIKYKKAEDSNLTSIQIACKHSHVNIVKYFMKYYKNKLPPNDLNVHYIHEHTRINCANLSLIEGNLNLANFLFYYCHADFHVIPYSFKQHFEFVYFFHRNNLSAFIHVCKFLVEIVCIEVSDNILNLDLPEEVKNYFKFVLQRSEVTLNVSSIRFEKDSNLHAFSIA